jgi:2-hydroxychromene-2-carboxylate isomerase
MSENLDWYFDFISPYAYLQFVEYPELFQRPDVALRPTLFAGLLNHWEHKGPAEIPEKRRFTFRYVAWDAARKGITLKAPPAHPFNPLPILRLAIALNCEYDAVRIIFDFVWREGRSHESEWHELCAYLGVIDADVRIAAPKTKDALRANTEAAIKAGVFGVPTFVAGKELFWGVDATPMLQDYLRQPTMFDTPEMRRIDQMPATARR